MQGKVMEDLNVLCGQKQAWQEEGNRSVSEMYGGWGKYLLCGGGGMPRSQAEGRCVFLNDEGARVK